MKKNVGDPDRVIRVALGIVGIALGIVFGHLWWIAAGVGVVLIATASVSFCPIYALFGIRTRKSEA